MTSSVRKLGPPVKASPGLKVPPKPPPARSRTPRIPPKPPPVKPRRGARELEPSTFGAGSASGERVGEGAVPIRVVRPKYDTGFNYEQARAKFEDPLRGYPKAAALPEVRPATPFNPASCPGRSVPKVALERSKESEEGVAKAKVRYAKPTPKRKGPALAQLSRQNPEPADLEVALSLVDDPEPANPKVSAIPIGSPEPANPKVSSPLVGRSGLDLSEDLKVPGCDPESVILEGSEAPERVSESIVPEVPPEPAVHTDSELSGVSLESIAPKEFQARGTSPEHAVPKVPPETAVSTDQQTRATSLELGVAERLRNPEVGSVGRHGALHVEIQPSEDIELRKVLWRDEHRPLAVHGNHRLGEVLLMLLRCDRELCFPLERFVPVRDELGASRRLSQLVVPSELQIESRQASATFGPWSVDKAALELLLSSPPDVAYTCPLLSEERFKPLILGGLQDHVCVNTHDLRLRFFRSGQTVRDLRRQLGQPKRSIAALCRCSRHWKVVAGDTVVEAEFVGLVWFLQNQ